MVVTGEALTPAVREHLVHLDPWMSSRSQPTPKGVAGTSRADTHARSVALRRRRRTAALGVLALVALITGLIAGGASAGGHSHRPAIASTEVGFLSKIQRLAGDGSRSFAAEQRV